MVSLQKDLLLRSLNFQASNSRFMLVDGPAIDMLVDEPAIDMLVDGPAID